MSGEIEFVDTNVIVYAHDLTAGRKREIARALLERLDASRHGALSIQVLQEFAVTVQSKLGAGLERGALDEVLEDLADWIVFCPGPSDVIQALALQRGHGISFWDAMIVEAALQVRASVLWTEDLNEGQEYRQVVDQQSRGVVARNPFRRNDRGGELTPPR